MLAASISHVSSMQKRQRQQAKKARRRLRRAADVSHIPVVGAAADFAAAPPPPDADATAVSKQTVGNTVFPNHTHKHSLCAHSHLTTDHCVNEKSKRNPKRMPSAPVLQASYCNILKVNGSRLVHFSIASM